MRPADLDRHAAANAEQLRLLMEETTPPAESGERLPGWAVWMGTTLLLSGVLGGWLVWRDLGMTLTCLGLVVAIVAASAWWAWGPE